MDRSARLKGLGMYSSTFFFVFQIGAFPNLTYRTFVYVVMYLDAVGIDLSNNHDKCCKVKSFQSQAKEKSSSNFRLSF